MPLPIKNYPRSKLLPGWPSSMQFYTIAEVAIILETKVGLVHEWIQESLLPAVQLSSEQHMLRIREQDLGNFIFMRLRKGLIKIDHLQNKQIFLH